MGTQRKHSVKGDGTPHPKKRPYKTNEGKFNDRTDRTESQDHVKQK